MKYVYSFLPGRVEGGGGEPARLLGNKGARLAEMCRMGLPVPPGFTISTEAFGVLRRTGVLPSSLRAEVGAAMEELGRELGLAFGDRERPLLVSVRSGAPVSMPGMMPTVSNVGLTRGTLPGLVEQTEDARFVYDTFRRLIETYARAVIEPAAREARDGAGVSAALAEHLERTLEAEGVDEEQLSPAHLARLCEEYLALVEGVARRPFPEGAGEQLWESVEAVLRSWDNRHAVAYRERAGVSHALGTAVTVQAMVFGNLGERSGAGVLFSRDPVRGARRVCGEWLPHAQGEDVVGGLVTPYALSAGARVEDRGRTLEESLPAAMRRLEELARLLEARYREAQEIEFVIQEARVWVLQTRSCKRSPLALARTAVEMAREGLITVEEALERTATLSPDDEVCWELEPSERTKATPLARGLSASVGVATGVLALTAERAERLAGEGKRVVFVGDTVAPEDIGGIDAAQALVTNTGGVASHLAVTARGWGKVCVVGCGTLEVDAARGRLRAAGVELREGDELTVDGNDGAVYAGRLARRRGGAEFEEYFAAIREWRRGREG